MLTPDISTDMVRQQKWWADWRRVDFSWAALANHEIESTDPSSVETTLQNYWRKDPVGPSSLIDEELLEAGEVEKDPSGRLWHIAHIPPAWDDGSLTWKADPNHVNWPRFWELLKKRIFALRRKGVTLTSEEELNEEKIQFAGVVFGRVPDGWEWHDLFDSLKIRFATCAFLDEADFRHVHSRTDLELRYCLFLRRADFDHLSIQGGLDLSDSTFVKQLSFSNAEISGDLKGNRIHCFGEATVLDSSIGGLTEISQSVFYGPNGFEKTTFIGDVNISYCRFLGLVSMAGATFRHDAKILECFFSSDDVTFTGECHGDFLLGSCVLEGSDVAYMQSTRGLTFRPRASDKVQGFKTLISMAQYLFEMQSSSPTQLFRMSSSMAPLNFTTRSLQVWPI